MKKLLSFLLLVSLSARAIDIQYPGSVTATTISAAGGIVTNTYFFTTNVFGYPNTNRLYSLRSPGDANSDGVFDWFAGGNWWTNGAGTSIRYSVGDGLFVMSNAASGDLAYTTTDALTPSTLFWDAGTGSGTTPQTTFGTNFVTNVFYNTWFTNFPVNGDKILYVSVVGSDAYGARGVFPWRTLHGALAAATNGDVVKLGSGYFPCNSSPQIPAGVTVEGSGEHTVIGGSFLMNDNVSVRWLSLSNSIIAAPNGIGHVITNVYFSHVTINNPTNKADCIHAGSGLDGSADNLYLVSGSDCINAVRNFTLNDSILLSDPKNTQSGGRAITTIGAGLVELNGCLISSSNFTGTAYCIESSGSTVRIRGTLFLHSNTNGGAVFNGNSTFSGGYSTNGNFVFSGNVYAPGIPLAYTGVTNIGSAATSLLITIGHTMPNTNYVPYFAIVGSTSTTTAYNYSGLTTTNFTVNLSVVLGADSGARWSVLYSP